MKKGFSDDATDLLLNLLEKDPSLWLGNGPKDSEEIKAHPFFASLDWDLFWKWEVKPFFVPWTKNEKDVKYIDKMFLEEAPVDTPVDSSHLSILQKKEKHFKNFTFSKESLLQQTVQDVDPLTLSAVDDQDDDEDCHS